MRSVLSFHVPPSQYNVTFFTLITIFTFFSLREVGVTTTEKYFRQKLINTYYNVMSLNSIFCNLIVANSMAASRVAARTEFDFYIFYQLLTNMSNILHFI